MTDLRDARLQQALDHAPDAHMAPDARTRAAIRAMAGQAIAPARPVPWWRRLAGASTSARMPWNAAFATVLLASLVTLIWRDEEIPGAKTGDPPMASAPPESPQKALAPQAAPAKPSLPPPASLPAPAPVPAAPVPAAESRRAPDPLADARAKKAETARAESQSKSAVTAPEAAQRERQGPALADAPAATQALPVPAPAPQAVPAPDRAMEAAPRAAPVPPAAMARMAPPAPAAPAAAMPSRQRDSQPMAEAARVAGAPGGSAAPNAARSGFLPLDDASLQGWTEARITVQGRTSLVSRAQAEGLAAQIRELALAVTGRNGAMAPVLLQIELVENGVVTGTLAVGEATARWTQLRGGFEQASSGSVDAARVRQLLAEAARLAPR